MAGDLLQFESWKGSRNVALIDVARRGFLGNNVEHILGKSRRWIFEHVAAVVRIVTGPAAFYRHTPASATEPGMSEGRFK